MARKDATEEKLARVAAAERVGDDAALANWLTDGGPVAALAAEAIGRRGKDDAIPALINAFPRFLRHPEADKGCRAKEAIISALDALRNGDPEPFRAGLRHVQMEPVWGGRVDTAVFLRAACVTALARLHPAEVHFDIQPLLYDPAPAPRQAAVRALAYLGGENSELLLRGKILAGDDEPDLLREAFAALLTIASARSLPFVESHLWGDDLARLEQAALALGASRLPEAYPRLLARWQANTDFALRQPLLLALALTRTDEAFDFLLAQLPEGGTLALLACDALVPYAADPRARERIEATIKRCRNPKLADRYTELVPPAP